MKRFLLSIPLVFCISAGFCQQQYFVFIQETSHRPFYVRMGDKNHSSSAGGHLILSKLQDTTYTFFIGFPRNKDPEQQFVVAINKKDRGYELKNSNGRWQLFDLQTLESINPVATGAKEAGTMQQKKTDSYSQLMAGVVNDSSVLYANTAVSEAEKQLAKEAEGKHDTAETKENTTERKEDTLIANTENAGMVKAKDSGQATGQLAVVKQEELAMEKKKAVMPVQKPVSEPVIKADSLVSDKTAVVSGKLVGETTDPQNIIRYSTENTVEGKLMIFIDRSPAVADTIRLIIPNL